MSFLRFSTKNTFVEVDVSNIDGSSKDSRKIQSWGGPARIPIVSEECSTDCSDEELLSEEGDWDTESADRFITAVYENGMDGHREIQKANTQPCDTPSCASSSIANSVAHGSPSLHPASVMFLQCPFVVSPMFLAPQATLGAARQASVGEMSRQAVETLECVNSAPTCRMVRNIPNDYTSQDLLDLLNAYNIAHDFVYLPMDWNKAANLGYAFVNLVSHDEALRTARVLSGFTGWKVQSQKVCDVVWGKANLQSVQRIIEKFRNHTIMHPDVPDTYKPMVFRNGFRVAFPDPTVQLQKPRGYS